MSSFKKKKKKSTVLYFFAKTGTFKSLPQLPGNRLITLNVMSAHSHVLVSGYSESLNAFAN